MINYWAEMVNVSPSSNIFGISGYIIFLILSSDTGVATVGVGTSMITCSYGGKSSSGSFEVQ